MKPQRSLSGLLLCLCLIPPLAAQPSLREKIGQMIMVTFTGDSLEKSTASLDTLRTDLAKRHIGGVIFFTWSNNLRSPAQIKHLTDELQALSSPPLWVRSDPDCVRYGYDRQY